MSTRGKRMVRVPVTVDVDVKKWCDTRGVTPQDMTKDVRRYVHHAVQKSLLSRHDAATLREEPGACPHTTADISVPRASLQDIWDTMLAEYAATVTNAQEVLPAGRTVREQIVDEVTTGLAASVALGRRTMYAELLGIPPADVVAALARGQRTPVAWPNQPAGR